MTLSSNTSLVFCLNLLTFLSCSKGAEVGDSGQYADTSVNSIPSTPLSCPTSEEEDELGTLTSPDLDEVSGVIHSPSNDGVLWVHNDSGDSPRIFGITEAGELLVTLNFAETERGDFEDIAMGELIYVGDVGDNGLVRDSVFVYGVTEPEVALGEAPYEQEVVVESYELTYPNEPKNVEAMWVDPTNDDIYLLTKVVNIPAEVYRKAAPHLDGSTTELELVASLDFSIAPLIGMATGADMSRNGTMIVVRGYIGSWVWLREPGESVPEALEKAPCQVVVPIERQSESIGFHSDGSGLFSISEGEGEPVYFIPFD
jgi:hypothetical protein